MQIKIGTPKVEQFIKDLEKPEIAKTLRTLDLLEQFGNQLRMPHSKRLDSTLFELRIKGKREVRILYSFRNKKVILLHCFIKKKQKTPKKHIQIAKKILKSIDPA